MRICKFAHCSSIFFSNRSFTPKIKVCSRAKRDRAIWKRDVPLVSWLGTIRKCRACLPQPKYPCRYRTVCWLIIQWWPYSNHTAKSAVKKMLKRRAPKLVEKSSGGAPVLVTVLHPFRDDRPDLRFAQPEAQFNLRGVVDTELGTHSFFQVHSLLNFLPWIDIALSLFFRISRFAHRSIALQKTSGCLLEKSAKTVERTWCFLHG